jgi:hypothetical protein
VYRKISESLVYEGGKQRHWTGTCGGEPLRRQEPHKVVVPAEKKK